MTIQNRQYVNNIQDLHEEQLNEEMMVLNEVKGTLPPNVAAMAAILALKTYITHRTKPSGDVDWIPDPIWDGLPSENHPGTWYLRPVAPPINKPPM